MTQQMTPEEHPRHSPAGGETAAVRLRGLTKSYGAVRAVDGIDLEIAPAELVAVLGPNGAGKSTVNEMITGLVQPDAGTVQIFGSSPALAVQSGSVGAMLQVGALLYDARARELLQLMHGLHRHPLPLEDVIELADLGSFLSTKTDKLSGGQQQRLRFALAIMADPELLILDEPTVGMDVEIRRSFWAAIREFAGRGRTVLFATHYLEEADQMADRIVVLNDGRVIADGTGAQIKSQVFGRTIELTPAGVAPAMLAALPEVMQADAVGRRVRLRTRDSDRTLRVLLARYPEVCDLEVIAPRLEDAFVMLTETADHHDQLDGGHPTGASQEQEVGL